MEMEQGPSGLRSALVECLFRTSLGHIFLSFTICLYTIAICRFSLRRFWENICQGIRETISLDEETVSNPRTSQASAFYQARDREICCKRTFATTFLTRHIPTLELSAVASSGSVSSPCRTHTYRHVVIDGVKVPNAGRRGVSPAANLILFRLEFCGLCANPGYGNSRRGLQCYVGSSGLTICPPGTWVYTRPSKQWLRNLAKD